MSTITYRTSDGDSIDQICQDFYGSTDGTVEMVLLANKKLALLPAVLPAGIVITLPAQEISTSNPSEQEVRLWD